MAIQLEWTNRALADIDRLHALLYEKGPQAALDAIDMLFEAISTLMAFPLTGRPLSSDDDDVYRELIVPYSNSGYLVLYHFDGDFLEILAVRHMREAGS